MSNGCGCSKGVLRFIKPPYAKKFVLPCELHDNDYDIGGDGEKRREADKILFLRMLKVSQKDCSNPYALTWFTLIALLYYVSVRIFGRFYFNYKKQER